MVSRAFASIVMLSALSCGPNSQVSSLSDIATASRVKTGMFLPETGEGESAAASARDRKDGEQLARLLGVDPKASSTGKLYAVPTYDGEKILVIQQGFARPLPIGGVDANGHRFYLTAHLAVTAGENVRAFSSSMFFKLPTADAEIKGYVSADGNTSNIYNTIDVQNDSGRAETFLVSHLNLLKTKSSPAMQLARIGSSIVETKSGRTVLQFRRLGHQVWRAYGIYSDGHLKHGSVVWSPDMSRYYSIREPGAEIVEWRKQDDNSMDIVSESTQTTVPEIVERLLEPAVSNKDLSLLPLTGPSTRASAWRATSLHEPLVEGAEKSALSLVDSSRGSKAPDSGNWAEYHRFFEAEAADEQGLALNEGAYSQYDPNNAYGVGEYVDLGNGVRGRVLAPTNVSVDEGYLWNTKTRTTLIETSPGIVREIQSVGGGAPEIRAMNVHDIRNQVAANQQQIESPQRQQELAEAQQKISEAQAAADRLRNTADTVGEKYHSPQGFIGNVVVPVATAGAVNGVTNSAGKVLVPGVQGVVANQVGSTAGAEAGKLAGKVAGQGGTFVGSTTAALVANQGDIEDAQKGLAKTGLSTGVNMASNGFSNGKVLGGAGAVGGVVLGAAIDNSQGKPVDLTNTSIDAASTALSVAANSALPGSGVAVGAAADGVKLGVNAAQAQSANIESSQAVASFTEPNVQNQMLEQALGNMTAE